MRSVVLIVIKTFDFYNCNVHYLLILLLYQFKKLTTKFIKLFLNTIYIWYY